MDVVLMRHGARGTEIDSSLINYQKENLELSNPEVWMSINNLINNGTSVYLKRIISSPYLRTRQTAEIVQYGIMKLTGKYLPITTNNNIGEYENRRCSWNVPTNDNFDLKTLELYNQRVPLYRESFEMFTQRTYNFYKTLEPGTLVITHNGVAELLGMFTDQVIKLKMGYYQVLATDRYTLNQITQ